jgi:hypothetical protein
LPEFYNSVRSGFTYSKEWINSCLFDSVPFTPALNFLSPFHFNPVARGAAVIAAALFVSASALAQVAVEEPASSEPDLPVISPNETNVLRADSSPAPIVENARPGAPVADTPRRFQYTLSAIVRGVYDDNIYNSPTNTVSDYYFTIEPSIALSLGGNDSVNSLSLVYRPSLFLFLDNSQNDTVQQVVHLAAGHVFGHLSLSLAQDIQILDGTDLNSLTDPTGHQANTDVQGRNKHQIYNTLLSGSYDLTGKLFLSGGGNFTADEYPSSLISSQTFGGNLFLNYNYSDKLVVGVGGTGGYNTTDPSINNQTFEQANVRLNYSATAKITLSASGGVEFRQFGSSSGSNVSPVYELAASYQPFDGTTLSLTGSRHTMNSASLAGQDYAETNINFSVTQRFMQRFYFGFAAGYTNSNYFSTISGVSDTRNDNFYYIDPSVDFNITRFWTFGAYYVHREDSSSFPFFSFKDNQVGLRTKLTF